MKKTMTLVVGLVSLLAMSFVFAEKVKSLYEASIPVASQSQEEKDRAALLALKEVVVKVSGDSEVLENPAIKKSINQENADALIQEFSYSASTLANTPYLLHVRFDTEGVNHLLRERDVAVWGQNRPLILAWIDYEAPNRVAVIVDSTSKTDIQQLLMQHAKRVGLPVILPVMDMSDMSEVDVNDIVTLSLPTLQSASKRYASDAMLIVRLLKGAEGFSLQSKMVMRDRDWDWTVTGKNMDEVISKLLNNVRDALSGETAAKVSDKSPTQLTLNVSHIAEEGDLLELIQYLNRLTPVANVEPIRITSHEALLKVSLRSSKNAFVEALSEGQELQPAGTSVDDRLDYVWNR